MLFTVTNYAWDHSLFCEVIFIFLQSTIFRWRQPFKEHQLLVDLILRLHHLVTNLSQNICHFNHFWESYLPSLLWVIRIIWVSQFYWFDPLPLTICLTGSCFEYLDWLISLEKHHLNSWWIICRQVLSRLKIPPLIHLPFINSKTSIYN